MFRHSSPSSTSVYYSDAIMQPAASFSDALAGTVPAQIPRSVTGGYFDGNGGAFSSPPCCYSSSMPSSYSYYNNIQRSISSHSLPMHIQLGGGGGSGNGFFSPSSPSPHQLPLPLPLPPPLSSSPSSSSGDILEFTSSCPVRRVFSTGDLQVPHRGSHQEHCSSQNSELSVNDDPRLMNSAADNETGDDERITAAAAGGVGRQLRPRRRRAVLAEGGAVQR
jgi:hypothetical protein